MKKINSVLIAQFIFLISCVHNAKEVPQRKITGINGEAIYVIKKDGTVWGMFKETYNVLEYQVLLKKDTIKIGSEFISTINVARPVFKIEISNPTSFTITEKSPVKEYHFSPEKEGVYEFNGKIEYDSLIVPFEYKFIVIK